MGSNSIACESVTIRRDAISDAEFLCDSIRQCLRGEEGVYRPGFPFDAEKLREAAVLVPLVERSDGTNVILTRRSQDLPKHAGQISFPGGRREASDESPLGAALRESHEEIGLLPGRVTVLGALPRYPTATGFMIHPFVGHIRDPGVLRRQPQEVEEIFEVPLAFFLNPDNHLPHEIQHEGQTYRLHAMPYQDYYIWGATAAILLELYQRLRRGAPELIQGLRGS